MQLFNFDLIVPEQQAEQQQQQGDAPPLCYVVDINYFPGVDKIVDFERRFVKLLWEGELPVLCHAKLDGLGWVRGVDKISH
jgi:hypothetical protein